MLRTLALQSYCCRVETRRANSKRNYMQFPAMHFTLFYVFIVLLLCNTIKSFWKQKNVIEEKMKNTTHKCCSSSYTVKWNRNLCNLQKNMAAEGVDWHFALFSANSVTQICRKMKVFIVCWDYDFIIRCD